jgi:hypothetical protein
MEILFQAITVLSTLFTLGTTIWMLISFRRERRIRASALLLSVALCLVMLPAFMLLSGARLNLWVGLPVLAVGLLVGFLRGGSTRLYYRNEEVVGKHSWWFLLGWGLSLALAQLLNLFGSALLSSLGLAPMFLSTGTQVGINGSMLLRRLRMRPPPAPPPTLPEGFHSNGRS